MVKLQHNVLSKSPILSFIIIIGGKTEDLGLTLRDRRLAGLCLTTDNPVTPLDLPRVHIALAAAARLHIVNLCVERLCVDPTGDTGD